MPGGVARPRFVGRLRVDVQVRIQPEEDAPVFIGGAPTRRIVGLNPIQIDLDELLGGDKARLQGLLDVGNRRLDRTEA